MQPWAWKVRILFWKNCCEELIVFPLLVEGVDSDGPDQYPAWSMRFPRSTVAPYAGRDSYGGARERVVSLLPGLQRGRGG